MDDDARDPHATKAIRVRILDREYPLRVAPADEGYTQHIAALVHERFQRIKDAIPNQPDLTHAVVGALEMAEELFAARAETDRLRAQIELEAQRLARCLDAVLAPAVGDASAGDGLAEEPEPPQEG